MKYPALCKNRKPNTHKGDYGHLLILAGSVGMSGAACLAAEAALRTGCGLVTLGVPAGINNIVERKLTEVMSVPLPQTRQKTISLKALPEIYSILNKKSALVIGPGLSTNKQTKELVLKLLPKIKIPTIIDADALNAVSHDVFVLKKSKAHIVITPHPGEMARLIGTNSKTIQKTRKVVAKTFANKYNVTVVLKGHNTVVAHPHKNLYINNTGNPGMATAGSGDVLSGIIGSFLAQGMNSFDAAKSAVFLHGVSGDIAAKDIGEVSLIAGDILKNIPKAIKKYNKPV